MKPYPVSLFIFRRDLRLEDNTALAAALSRSDQVIPAFVFDPRQVLHNPYKSERALQFMIRSLDDLDHALRARGARLYGFAGEPQDVLAGLARDAGIGAVFFNRDYTPFSIRRDLALQKRCASLGIACETGDDATLTSPGSVAKDGGGPYTMFTPYFRKAFLAEIPWPQMNLEGKFFAAPVSGEVPRERWPVPESVQGAAAVSAGRSEARKILQEMRRFKEYARQRDIPFEAGTTRLSAHLKFGTVSVREVYHAVKKTLGEGHPLIRQLYWRDFFTQIAYHFPHVFGNAFYGEYDAIPWQNDKRLFRAWCRGETGFPIVDAGMRELHATGFMHNRLRMIVSSFLVKDLHIDWRWGEKYFARNLVDYDPAVNNGNWQWAASTGCDHQPYFRIFNPWLQQRRFDPQALYIKQWVPELAAHAPRQIHSPDAAKARFSGYPDPVISHADGVSWAKSVYRDALRRGKKY